MFRIRFIFRFFVVQGIRVKVWFKGQLVICDICRREGYRVGFCLNKGRCFRCYEFGYVFRNCFRFWGNYIVFFVSVFVVFVYFYVGNGMFFLINVEDLDFNFGFYGSDDGLAEVVFFIEVVFRCDFFVFGDVVFGVVNVFFVGIGFIVFLDERFNQFDEFFF